MGRSSQQWSAALAIGIVALLTFPAAAGLGPGLRSTGTPTAGARSGPLAPPAPQPYGSLAHDLLVTTPAMGGSAGVPMSFTASLAGIAGVSSPVNWTWGDGSATSGGAAQLSHTFADPGLYEVGAQTTDALGTSHDNWQTLLALPIRPTHTGDTNGTAPQLAGWVVRNGTSTAGATAVLPLGGSVTVSTELAEPIPAPSVTAASASFAVPGALTADATFSGQTLDALGVSTTTVAFSSAAPAGLYPLTFSFSATVHADNTSYSVVSAFVFTVALGGGAGGGAVPYAQSADATTLTAYWLAGPSASAPDPAIDWESNGAQLFRNVYQTLLIPNGSATGGDPGSFLPEMAACVPGSAQCTALFGSSLVTGYNYTFVLSNTSRFYDPVTGGSWPVYPTDVEFSIARSLAYVVGYCTTCTNGWMLAGALLPIGNPSWDGSLHYPYNDTPAAIAASMSLNDSTDCPHVALSAPYDGCITFRADGVGGNPPYFLQLLADPTGGTIEPCGWFSSSNQNAGLPYWTQGNISGAGDAPCPVWGTGGIGTNPGSLNPTVWDAYELNAVFSNEGLVYTTAAGSGPYYLAQWSNFTGYTLGANPAYAANPNCVGAACEPAAGTYVPNVVVDYELSSAPGLAALASGAADWAQAGPADTGTLAADAAAGIAYPSVAPALEVFGNGFNFQYNATLATNLTGLPATAPSGFLTDLNLRQFLIAANPTANVTADVFNANGTAAAFSYGGGVIPLEDGGAAPSNVSWPSGNPDANPSHAGSAAWWWNRTSHDTEAGPNCTALAPCKFPVDYLAPDPLVGAAETQWAASVVALSDGAIVPEVFAANITDYLNVLFPGPSGNPFAVSAEGWINDFPDASDPAIAFLAESGTYGFANDYSVLAGLTTGSCSSSVSYWANLATPIPYSCQGAAYGADQTELGNAQPMALGAAREAAFAQVDQIAQHLGLYGAVAQLNTIAGVAAWIDPSSLSSNPWLSTDGLDWYSVRERTGPATPLSLRGPVAAPPVLPSTAPLNLSADAVGGAGGYTYAWSGLPAGCVAPAAASFTCHPNTAGTFTVTVTVHDALAHVASGSLTILITGLTIASFTTSPTSVQAGQTTTITTVLAVATIGVAYAYTGLPGSCPSVNASSFACTPSQAGVYHLGVTATAPNGSRGAAFTTLTVTSGGLTIANFTATPGTIDLASSTTFTVGIVNATGYSATAAFSGVPGCAGTASARNITTPAGSYFGVSQGCTPSMLGAFTAVVNVTSGTSYALAMTTLTVTSAPTIQLVAAPTAIDVGQPVTFTATTANGSAPFTFSYTGLPSGCNSTDSATITCTPTGPATSVVTVHLQDADSKRASATATVTVSADLALVQFVAVPDSVGIGGSTNLSVRVNGGTAPLTYTYTGLPASCPSSDTGVLLCLPTTPGTYTVNVTVRDAAGTSVSGTTGLTVTGNGGAPPPPTVLGLPQAEGYGLIALLVLVVVVAGIAFAMRRPKAPPPEADRPPDDGPDAGG